ncbi:hypothetical protein [Dyella humicola]|uniref:hypothetical protein n=1 Tax=Dyella humicola TaxID=2992126 RepID=UPI00225181D3|nr:hypothetical protein [Dyella humicola]
MSKKAAKGQLSALAHDVLEGLDTSGKLSPDLTQELIEMSAATRKDFLEALRERSKAKGAIRQPSSVVEFLAPLLSPGAANKPDFLPRYLRSLFDCAQALCSEPPSAATAPLFMRLIGLAEAEAIKAKGSPSIHFEALSSIESIVSAFDATLSSGDHHAELTRSRASWLPLVPEIAAKSNASLSQAGATALIAILGNQTHELPTAVRLSIEPLLRVAGRRSTEATHPAQPVAEIAHRLTTQQAAIPGSGLLPEAARFAEDLQGLVVRLSTRFEERLENLRISAGRLESEKSSLESQLKASLGEAEIQRRESVRLKEELRTLRIDIEESRTHATGVQLELEKYKARHDVIIQDSDTRERDSAARTRRELVDKQLRTLLSVRDCLAELNCAPNPGRPVRQAVTNFNNFVRFLVHSSYIASEQIPKIETSSVPGETLS